MSNCDCRLRQIQFGRQRAIKTPDRQERFIALRRVLIETGLIPVGVQGDDRPVGIIGNLGDLDRPKVGYAFR